MGGIMFVRRLGIFAVLLAVSIVAVGCAIRSISNSGYPGDSKSRNPYYQGELSELEVLGAPESQKISEEDIRKALEGKQAVKLQKGESMLVIQSGALSPDESMLDELSKHFRPVAFAGIPNANRSAESESYSKKLRLVAAQGGYTHILCYWGVLETAQEDKATKAVSWVPIAGAFVPDESQRMRIRLRAALVDVASARWSMLPPEPIDDSALSSQLTRVRSDQKQVELLKAKGYAALASELSRYFVQ